jgi:hypothetical protein
MYLYAKEVELMVREMGFTMEEIESPKEEKEEEKKSDENLDMSK